MLRKLAQLSLLSLAGLTGLLHGQSCNFNETGPLKPAILEKAYSVALTIDDTACGPFRYFKLVSGSLPPGMTLNSDGVIAGRPTAAGVYAFGVRMIDGFNQSIRTTLSIEVQPAATFGKRVMASGRLGTSYNDSPGVTPSNAFFERSPAVVVPTPIYTVPTGALPPGLAVNSLTGVISGTPSQAGTFDFVLRAAGLNQTVSAAYRVVILGSSGPVITTTTLPGGAANQSYSATIGQTGATSVQLFASTLPAGLTLNTTTGQITGTPTQSGTFFVTVQAPGGANGTAYRTFILNISNFTGFNFDSGTSLRQGTSGGPWAASIVPTGGIAPYTVDLVGVPTFISSDNGLGLRATSPTGGTFLFTINLTDAAGVTRSRTVSYSVGTMSATFPANAVTEPVTINQAVTTGALALVTPSGGVAPLRYEFFPGFGLPAGLTLNTATGAISGTPTEIGNYQLRYTITDSSGVMLFSNTNLTINVANPLTFTTPAALPSFRQGSPYSMRIRGTGGYFPSSFNVTGGALPGGLTLNSTTGVISGSTTVGGPTNFNFTITMGDIAGRAATRNFTLVGAAGFQFITAELPIGYQGLSYSQRFEVGGATIASYSLSGTLPGGLTFNSDLGEISGFPNQVGTFPITVRANSVVGTFVTRSFTLIIAQRVGLTSAVYPTGAVGVGYESGPAQGTGFGDLIYLPFTLPTTIGIVFDPMTGKILGDPTTLGTTNFSIRVFDANSSGSDNFNRSLTVANPVIISTHVLANPTRTVAYNQKINSSSATAGVILYSVESGTLPTGLTLDSTSGTIAGTPTANGTFNFTVRATHENGIFDEEAYTLVVSDPLSSSFTLQPCTIGTLCQTTLSVLGGRGEKIWSTTSTPVVPLLGIVPSTDTFAGLPLGPAGNTSLSFNVTDADDRTLARTLTQTVNNAPAILTGSPLPNGEVNVGYSTTIATSGGTAPLNFATLNGTLPAGITINSLSGVISGTAGTPGTSTFDVRVTDAVGAVAQRTFQLTILPALTITTTSLPSGLVNQNYSQVVQVAGAVNGTTFSVPSGALPNGLSIDSTTGLIDGVPTRVGTFNFTVRVDDGAGRFAQRALAITINSNFTISTTSPLPAGTVGTAYTQTIATSNAAGAVEMTITGSLPAGLQFLNNTISGTPTAAGTATFTVNATDGAGATASRTFTLTVNPALRITTTSLPSGQVGTNYNQTVVVDGAVNGQTLTVFSGSLPNGLTLNQTSGLISGPPTQVGTFNFTVQVTDGLGRTAQRALAITIGSQFSLTTASPLPFGSVGTNYSQTFQTANATGAVNLSLTAGTLPPGLEINSTTLSGLPTTAGTFNFTILATDSSNAQASRSYQLVIHPTLSITTTTLPNGVAGTAYNQTVQTSGAVNGQTLAVSVGALPAGLTLDSTTGLISGTPTQVQTSNFTLRLTDGLGRTTTRAFTLQVTSNLSFTTTSPLATGTTGTAYAQAIETSGAVGTVTLSVTAGALPNGVAINGNSLSGTPTAAGTFSFTLRGADVAGGVTTRAYQITINPALTITTSSLPNGEVGTPYSQPVVATGVVNGQTYTIFSGNLPAGLSIDSTSGVVSGDPTQIGTANFVVQVQDGLGRTAQRPLSITIGSQFSIATPSPLPFGSVGTAYSQAIATTNASGVVTMSSTGTLPPGIALSGTTLTGTPTTAGTFNFTINASDDSGAQASQAYALTIHPTFTITTTTLPGGTAGASYNQTVAVSGAVNGFRINLFSGSLPNGLTLNTTSGAITGTPTQVGTNTFVLQATDGLNRTTQRTLSITIGSTFTITTNSPLPDGTVGTAYSLTFQVSGNSGAVTYSTTGTLPPGLTLNGAVLAGTPTTAGTYNFNLNANDAAGAQTGKSFSIIIQPQLQITTTSLPGGQVGTAYNQTVQITGAVNGQTFTLPAGALPGGLALQSSTGVILGTPTQTGTFNFTVRVSDGLGRQAERAFGITIGSTFAISTVSPLPAGTVGSNYSLTFQTSNASLPVTFSLETPAPAGLTLTGPTLSGTPTTAGTFQFILVAEDAAGAVADREFTITIHPALTITTTSLPNGQAGQAYNQTVQVAGAVNGQTVSLSAGVLPPGLTLNSATGAITGTPTQVGSETFTVSVTDGLGRSAERAFSITIGSTLTITTASPLPVGTVNSPYSLTIQTANATGAVNFAVTAGALPAGLSLNSTTGLISGTPTASGDSNFSITATDSANATAVRAYVVFIRPVLTITTTSLPNGLVGAAYSSTIQVSGAINGQTLTVVQGSGSLPPGLSLNSSSGLVSGNPTAAGSYSFTARVTDGQLRTFDRAFTITIGQFIITTTSLPAGTQGLSYAQTITATGGVGSVSFSTNSALPLGLTLSSGGNLSGIPAQAGTFPLTVTARDSQNNTANQNLTLVINGPLTITTTSMNPAAVGVAFSQQLTTSGAVGAVTWALQSGSLPSGYSLNSTTGVISGNTQTNDVFNFTVRAQDSAGQTATRSLTLTVSASLFIFTTNLLPGIQGTPYSAAIETVGHIGARTWTIDGGGLPPGLGLNSTTGLISGIPTTVGVFNFTVGVRDSQNRYDSRPLVLTILPPFAITTTLLPRGTVGSPYSAVVNTVGATGSVAFNLAAGALPPGLALNSTTGSITGLPTTNGSFNFTVRAVDGANRTSIQPYQVTILQVFTLSGVLPNAVLNVPYTGSLVATGQSGSVSYFVTNGTLPPGLLLSSATGQIAGTPSVVGSYTFTATAIDALEREATGTFTISVASSLQLSIVGVPFAYTGEAYQFQPTALGGTAPYQFGVVGGALPAGLALNSATGFISGTPTVVGTSTFRLRLTDGRNSTSEADGAITVRPGLQITTFNFGAVRGQPFSGNLEATGGIGPYTWSLVSGALPNGITFAPIGTVTGTTNDPEGTYNFVFRVTDSRQVSRTQAMTFGVQPAPLTPLSISPTSVPNAVVGRPYSVQLSGAGGVTPYTFVTTSGATPTGITLSGAGLLAGTPTAPGTFTFAVTMTDGNGRAAGETYTIRVDAPLVVTPDALPSGVINTPYSASFGASGGRAPYTFVLTGNVPAGLTFVPATGAFNGTPTESGTFGLTFEVTDAVGTRLSRAYSLVINGQLSISTASPLPEGTVATPYGLTFAAQGGTTPYRWGITAGSLPGGLTLDPATGAVSGTPTGAGTESFTVEVTDGRGLKASRGFSITIFPPLVLSAGASATGTINTPLTFAASASGGKAPYLFALRSGTLPPGMALGNDGSVSGTPTEAGTFNFTLQVTDALRNVATRQVAITIGTNLLISTTALPTGQAGAPYSGAIAALGGTAPLIFSISAGELPPGLALGEDGSITGTPTAAGTFNFTARVVDRAGAASTRQLSITVTLPELPPTTVTGVPATITQGQQPSLAVNINQPFPVDVAGVLTLTFTNDAVNPADDPAVRFVATGSRTLSFTIPAGQTAGQFGVGGSAFQVGTVAGTVRITSVLTPVGGTAQPGPTATTVLARIAPVVTQSSVQQSGNTITISLAGFSNTRELSQAVIRLTPVPGANLATTQLTVALTDLFNTYYRSAASVPFGGQFALTLPFTLSGDPNAVASVDVTLTNVTGTSQNVSLRLR